MAVGDSSRRHLVVPIDRFGHPGQVSASGRSATHTVCSGASFADVLLLVTVGEDGKSPSPELGESLRPDHQTDARLSGSCHILRCDVTPNAS